VRGYCSILVPTSAGRHELEVEMYRPISGSWCHEVMNWWKGTLPEYYETAFTARSEGREVTRVKSNGKIHVCLNVSTKDMEKFGFASGNGTDSGTGNGGARNSLMGKKYN